MVTKIVFHELKLIDQSPENPQVTEPAWFTKSTSFDYTTESSWTRSKKITPNPHYRNTYKYVEYHHRTPAPGEYLQLPANC